MKKLLKLIAVLAIINMIGRADITQGSAGNRNTSECLRSIVCDIKELAECFGVTVKATPHKACIEIPQAYQRMSRDSCAG